MFYLHVLIYGFQEQQIRRVQYETQLFADLKNTRTVQIRESIYVTCNDVASPDVGMSLMTIDGESYKELR